MKLKLVTLTELTTLLNERFDKKTGNGFTISDTQGYIRRGCLPKYLGCKTIKVHKEHRGVLLYELKD